MSVRVTVQSGNLAKLAEQAAQRATQIVMGELNNAFQQSLSAQAWEWPRPTKRTVGTVTSPRNILDTGNLRDTNSWQMSGPYEATFKWSAQYATGVHEGYVTKLRGGRQGPGLLVPARPWTRAVLGQENVSGIVTYDIGDRLKNVWLAQLRR
jgi:hypothetical protein